MIIYTPPAPAKSIPLVDLAKSYSPRLDDRLAVAWHIHKALREVGFFYVANHSVPAELMRGQIEAARQFFALPEERKMAVSAGRSFCRRGYEPMLKQRLDDGSPPDLKESFMIARELPLDHPYVQRRVPQQGPNQWPDDLPALRPQTLSYQRHMIDLGRHLLSGLALSLELAEDFFAGGLTEPQCAIRMLRYPPQPASAAFNQLGAGAHTDWGSLTILLQDDCAGLEVQNVAGDWILATPIPETFVINVGQLMERMTNGLYRATPHRVMNNTSGRDRHSIATFFDFDYFHRVECLPTCRPENGEPLYAPATVGEHIEDMARRAYA